MKSTSRLLSAISLVGIVSLALTGCEVNLTGFTDTVSDTYSEVKDASVELASNGNHHSVIVPGYGAPVVGNATYEEYIEEVANYVNDTDNEVSSVVFTGSYSTLEDTSEAESMNSYFNSVANLDDIRDRGIAVHKEECAIVSWQNISNSKELLVDHGIRPGKVTVFGDENREDKLKSFADYKFNEDQEVPEDVSDVLNGSVYYTPVVFEGFNFGDSTETEEERNTKFLAEIAAAYDAELGNQILEMRINEWTEEFNYDVADNLVAKGCSEFEGFR